MAFSILFFPDSDTQSPCVCDCSFAGRLAPFVCLFGSVCVKDGPCKWKVDPSPLCLLIQCQWTQFKRGISQVHFIGTVGFKVHKVDKKFFFFLKGQICLGPPTGIQCCIQ